MSDLHKCLPALKSYCLSIKKKGNKIIIDGEGWGHLLGLCQWGARSMIRKGHDVKKVLAFYYPGTTYMKLCGQELFEDEE